MFRDYASGEIELDSFDYGNYADLNAEYGSEEPEGPEDPGGEPEDPNGGNGDTPAEGGLTGGEIAGIAVGCAAGVAVIVGVSVYVVKRKKK